MTFFTCAHARAVIAGTLGIMGLGRLGLFSYGGPTTLPAVMYGALMLALAAALFATTTRYRSRILGRAVAGLGMAALAGLAADLWATGGSLTSVLILLWLAGGLLVDAVGHHEC